MSLSSLALVALYSVLSEKFEALETDSIFYDSPSNYEPR
jgi:hypothetical protein